MGAIWACFAWLWLAGSLAAQTQPNPFETPGPWTAAQIEKLLSGCRKPALKELKGRWQAASMLSKQYTGDATSSRIFMRISRNPETDDAEDFMAVFDIPDQTLAEAGKQLGVQRREDMDVNTRYRVDMEREPDAAVLIHTLLRAKLRAENYCKISPKGHLICRNVQIPLAGAASTNTVTTYTGYVRVKPPR